MASSPSVDTEQILTLRNQPGTCAICETPLRAKISYVDDKLFHSDCFKCCACQITLDTKFAGSVDDPYCVKCYVRFRIKCDGCNQPFEGNTCFEIFGKRYHRQCMKFTGCQKPLENKYYQSGDNVI